MIIDMKEKNIKTIIRGFTEQYGYLLEDIRSKDSNSELWTVSKDISGIQYRLMFMTQDSLNELIKYDIPDDKNNIYVLNKDGDLMDRRLQIVILLFFLILVS